METLTGVSIGPIDIYDMSKAIDKSMVISDIHLLESKSGGKKWKLHPELQLDYPCQWNLPKLVLSSEHNVVSIVEEVLQERVDP